MALRLLRERHRRQFFQQSDATAQRLLTFAVFALGFAARPIGCLVLGRVGGGSTREPLRRRCGVLLANTLTCSWCCSQSRSEGWLSDRIGRRKLMLILIVATMVLIVPALRLMPEGAAPAFMLGQILLALPVGMALELQGAMIVEILPLRTRVTSMSVAYSVTRAFAGGTAPLVSAWLIDTLGYPLALASYTSLRTVRSAPQ